MNRRMYGLGSKSSVIREIFEYGKRRAAEIGAENVYDFSLGNPSVAPPQAFYFYTYFFHSFIKQLPCISIFTMHNDREFC